MSGYGGCDDESLHAMILAENAIHASQQLLIGGISEFCFDCGEQIPEARRAFLASKQMKCYYCIDCQTEHDKPVKVKMLDHVL